MKIVTIVGARPQFIKAAVVSRAIQKQSGIEEIIVHTGQHYDHNMSTVFFKEMSIPSPHYDLNVNGLNHGAMTGHMMEKLEPILQSENPDKVMVYGDTDSTLAGALSAVKLHIPIVHVEAGLRSYNMAMPEEINRIITDRISSILFCPTQTAVSNLKKEGFDSFPCNIIQCGDVMYDAAMFYASKATKPQELPNEDYILCTIHRAENTDNLQILNEIFSSLNYLAEKTLVIIPIHPRTKSKLEQLKFDFQKSKIQFINPVGYFEMLYLIQHSILIITDSGGLQKEAYFFKKKCVTLREQTEWTELVLSGCNILAGTNKQSIIKKTEYMLSEAPDFTKSLYGNGKAGEKIVENME